jgi:aromatic-L-amino-acid decarboxylase
MDIEQFRKAGYQAVDRICDYYYSLLNTSQPVPVVSQVKPGYLAKELPSEAPHEGEQFEVIADDFQKLIMPGITHWQHPSFFAYFPSAATFEGILGDLYFASVSNPGFNWVCSPACTELEAVVMDWSAKLFGLDYDFHVASGKGGGVLQSTASDSTLITVIVARSRFCARNPSVPLEKLVVYGTTQTHSVGAKAALILGLEFRALEVRKEDNFALRGETLMKALEEDRSAGKEPFVLVATVGTTSSGAIDDLDEIGEMLGSYPDIWLHVDAAWAGVALACPEYRTITRLDAINKFADSFCTNFHKWGLVNFDASALWVRDRKALTNALDVTPEYLRTKEGDAGMVIDYRNWQLALGRRSRSFKVWFVLRSFGIQGFQSHIRKGIEHARTFASLIRSSDKFELVTPPSFALVVFRLVPPTSESASTGEKPLSRESINGLNRDFFARISARPEIYLTQTDLAGTFCIRLAVGGQRTQETHVREAFEIISYEADVTLKAWAAGASSQYGAGLDSAAD